MIRIAFIIDTIATPAAGTEQQLLMLLEGLDRTRFEPTLVCLRESEWLRGRSFAFDVEILGLESILSPSFFGALAKFRALHRAKRFDIVQTFFKDGNLFGTMAARLSGIKTVVSSRRNIGYWHTGFHKVMLRFLRRWTSCYLANSKAVVDVATRVERVDSDRITIIYNGLDLEKYTNLSGDIRLEQRQTWGVTEDEILIGAVANLRPVKNLSALVTAAGALVAGFGNLRFVVVGEGPQRRSLQEQIDQLNLTERFHLVGAAEDIVPCLAAFDIGVLCSESESFSNSIVEYMAAGLPIAASDVGGNAEAIQHRENGLLYSLDDTAGLEGALKELLTDTSGAKRLAAVAREAAFARYSREKCIQSHQDYYLSIVNGRGGK